MEIITQDFLYYPPREDGRKAFAVIPRENVAGSERVQFDRAVAFGVVADKVNELWESGCRSIVAQKARMRPATQYGRDLQLVILADGTTDELYAQRQKPQLPADQPVTDDDIPF